MAWRWIPQAIETGVVTDPRDLVRNQAEFAGEFNGHIDRDNVATSGLSVGKFEPYALVSVEWSKVIGAPLQTITEGAGGAWVNLVDDAATTNLGAGLPAEIDVEDGELIIDAQICGGFDYSAAAAFNQKWSSRLLVNGLAIAHTGWSHESRKRTVQSMTGSATVVRGQAVISLQIRAWSDLYFHLSAYSNGTALSNPEFITNHEYTIADLDILNASLCIVHRKH